MAKCHFPASVLFYHGIRRSILFRLVSGCSCSVCFQNVRGNLSFRSVRALIGFSDVFDITGFKRQVLLIHDGLCPDGFVWIQIPEDFRSFLIRVRHGFSYDRFVYNGFRPDKVSVFVCCRVFRFVDFSVPVLYLGDGFVSRYGVHCYGFVG